MNTIDLTPIIEAVIGIVAALVSLYLIPWLKSRTTAQQQEYIRVAVEVAVYGAEKLYGAGRGEEKLNYARQRLLDMGIDIDFDRLKVYVDAAIKKMELEERPKALTEGE